LLFGLIILVLVLLLLLGVGLLSFLAGDSNNGGKRKKLGVKKLTRLSFLLLCLHVAVIWRESFVYLLS
jgi:hypothetical protein